MNILTLFCHIDDFCLAVEPLRQRRLLADGTNHRHKSGSLALSEVTDASRFVSLPQSRALLRAALRVTDDPRFVSLLRLSGCQDLLSQEVIKHLDESFPKLVSYNRFVESACQRTTAITNSCLLNTYVELTLY